MSVENRIEQKSSCFPESQLGEARVCYLNHLEVRSRGEDRFFLIWFSFFLSAGGTPFMLWVWEVCNIDLDRGVLASVAYYAKLYTCPRPEGGQ